MAVASCPPSSPLLQRLLGVAGFVLAGACLFGLLLSSLL